MLRTEPAVMDLTVFPGKVSNPDGDAVYFDVLHGAADEIIGRLRDLGLEQRGSIVMENVGASISALAGPRPAVAGSSNSRLSGLRSKPGSGWRERSHRAGSRC